MGNSLTIADLGLLEVLLNIEDYMGVQYLQPYPALQVTRFRTNRNRMLCGMIITRNSVI